jgi:hypothetical protein
MSVFGVTAAKCNANGIVEEVTIRQIDPQTNSWIGEPGFALGHEVASMVLNGHKVLPIFVITGEIIPGPEFRQVTLSDGRETIELTESSPGRTLQDLIHNVQDQS